jgi:hypothetical protein
MKLYAGVVGVALLVSPVLGQAKAPPPKVDYEANLKFVPPTDPAPGKELKIVPALKGVHPRLLFTKQEIARTKELAQTDPVLKRAYDDTTSFAKRFKMPAGRPDVVLNDTPALWKGVGQWMGLAYAYGLDKDPAVKKNIVDVLTAMVNEPYWADALELDSNMGAGNNMLMVATLFDAAADDLEPEFRKKVADKLLLHVRRMWYIGHQQKAVGVHKYWQQDPANNHRWHRAAGMVASLLAIADEPGINVGYILEQMKGEMDFLLKYYPHDGDCHEGSGYQQFGFMYLLMASQMMDRVVGTEYLKHPGFANAWAQRLYYWAPGRQGDMSFGDSQNSPNAGFDRLDSAFFISPKLSRDKNVQAALLRQLDVRSKPAAGKTWSSPWTLLAYYDPTVGAGDINAVPTNRLFADLGAASFRDKWADDAVAFTFKCGPYGGYVLNKYRHEVLTDGKPHYINVAHDDPDANSFALASDGEFWFHPGVYSKLKKTEENNTITVDGKGQIGEGSAYTQPVKDTDMRTLSYLVGWKQGDAGRVIIEGEAGKAYPGLTGFRRTAVWLPGEYILLLDDVKATADREIAWRGVVEKGTIADGGKGTIETKSGRKMNFQVSSNQKLESTTGDFKLVGRWGDVPLNQIQFATKASAVKYAVVIDAWKTQPQITLKEDGDTVTLTVKTATGEDTWTWTSAKDAKTPTALEGKRGGKSLIVLTEKDSPRTAIRLSRHLSECLKRPPRRAHESNHG